MFRSDPREDDWCNQKLRHFQTLTCVRRNINVVEMVSTHMVAIAIHRLGTCSAFVTLDTFQFEMSALKAVASLNV